MCPQDITSEKLMYQIFGIIDGFAGEYWLRNVFTTLLVNDFELLHKGCGYVKGTLMQI